MAAYGTLASLKAAIQKDDDDADTTLNALLEAASRKIDQFCNRPDGFVAENYTIQRRYRGSGMVYQLIDECVEIEQVAVKDSASDIEYEVWTTPNAGTLAANLTIANSGTFTADAAGLYEADDIVNLWDGINEAWLDVTSEVGGGVYRYSLRTGTAGDVFSSGLTIGSTGDWIAFTGDPDEPDFDSLPHTALLIDTNGDYEYFISGSVSRWDGRDYRRGMRRRGRSILANQPTVRVTARWGYADSVPADISQASVMLAARFFKRLEGSMSDSLASTELGQLQFVQQMDPDVASLLVDGRYVRPAVGRR